MKKSNFWRGMTATLALLLCLTTFGTNLAFTREGDVNLFLGTLPPAVAVSDDTNYYPSSYATMDEMREAQKQYLIQSQEEGSVLLRNENVALPLSEGASVTLFGYAAATPVYHGGSGGPPNTGINLYDALKEEGIRVNKTVYSAIANTPSKSWIEMPCIIFVVASNSRTYTSRSMLPFLTSLITRCFCERAAMLFLISYSSVS